MNSDNFKIILQKAILGSRTDIDKILKIYTPLINNSSYIKGKLDET